MKSILNIFKYIAFAVLIQITASSTSYASDAKNAAQVAFQYNQATSLYNQEKYSEALKIYEKLIDEGIKNSDLFYNASDAAFRNGSLGKAILFLERARKIEPSDKDIKANLEYLNSIKKDKEQVSDPVNEFLSNAYNSIDIDIIGLFSAISFFFTALLFSMLFFFKVWKKTISIIFSVLITLIFISSTIIFIHRAYIAQNTLEAVIMTEEAKAYSGPGTDNSMIFIIHEGTKVVIERSNNSWNLVRLKSGAGGWISSDTMEKI
jgi:tetratricopeptide (TPR) repeat protein